MLAHLTSSILETEVRGISVTQIRVLPDRKVVEVRWGSRSVMYQVSNLARLKEYCEKNDIKYVPPISERAVAQATAPAERKEAARVAWVQKYAPNKPVQEPLPLDEEVPAVDFDGAPEPQGGAQVAMKPAKIAESQQATLQRFHILEKEYGNTKAPTDGRIAATCLRKLAANIFFTPARTMQFEWRDNEDKCPHHILLLVPKQDEAQYARMLLAIALKGDWNVEVEIQDGMKRLVHLSSAKE